MIFNMNDKKQYLKGKIERDIVEFSGTVLFRKDDVIDIKEVMLDKYGNLCGLAVTSDGHLALVKTSDFVVVEDISEGASACGGMLCENAGNMSFSREV